MLQYCLGYAQERQNAILKRVRELIGDFKEEHFNFTNGKLKPWICTCINFALDMHKKGKMQFWKRERELIGDFKEEQQEKRLRTTGLVIITS